MSTKKIVKSSKNFTIRNKNTAKKVDGVYKKVAVSMKKNAKSRSINKNLISRYTYPVSKKFKYTTPELESVANWINKILGKKALDPQKFASDFTSNLENYFSKNEQLRSYYDELVTKGTSMGKQLKWGLSFIKGPYMHNVHMHPTIEYSVIIDGKWFEKRLKEPLTKTSEVLNTKPSEWELNKLQRGDFLINYPGIVHTDFNKPGDYTISVLLWSGNEHNVRPEYYPEFLKTFIRKQGFNA
jgi:hypothetical protein